MEAPKQDFSMTLNKIDEDEKLLAIIKHHPFGIIKVYLQVFIGLIFAGGLIMMLLPELISRDEYPDVYVAIGIVSIVLLVFMVLIMVVATIIYYMSKIVVTDQTITQTIQNGIFNRKVSQLAMSSVEDVTALKKGFFPTILNFGKLTIETAGEQENFHFEYCGRADHYAKLILEARQEFMGRREMEIREEGQAYDANMAFKQNQQSYQQPYQRNGQQFSQQSQQQFQQVPQHQYQNQQSYQPPYQQNPQQFQQQSSQQSYHQNSQLSPQAGQQQYPTPIVPNQNNSGSPQSYPENTSSNQPDQGQQSENQQTTPGTDSPGPA